MSRNQLTKVAIGAAAGYAIARVVGARGGIAAGVSFPLIAAAAGAAVAYKWA